MADTEAKIKVQIFVLKKDTADIITAWAQDKAESLGIASLTQTHIEKLSGDNTREEKDRVMGALRTGYILFFLNYIVIISICRSLN